MNVMLARDAAASKAIASLRMRPVGARSFAQLVATHVFNTLSFVIDLMLYAYIGMNIFGLQRAWHDADTWRSGSGAANATHNPGHSGPGGQGKAPASAPRRTHLHTVAWASPTFVALAYALLLATRFVMVFTLGALANLCRRRPLHRSELLVIWWAGQLRGAVALAIALAVGRRQTKRCSRQRSHTQQFDCEGSRQPADHSPSLYPVRCLREWPCGL